MENASKALIIAGAVLISIVLVSLAVILISNSGNGGKDDAQKAYNKMQNQSSAAIDKLNVTF